MDTITINLTGWVGYSAFSADYVDYMLEKHTGKPVTVIISSFGGYTNDSLRICSAFRRHGDVTVHYTGMNASAATIAGMGARKITIESSAFWMVHNASSLVDTWSRMNAQEMEQYIETIKSEIDTLKTLDKGVAALYASRCKKSPAELAKLMAAERWMTATEALEWGFADEIVETAGKKLPQSVVMAVSEAGLPDIPGYKSSFTDRIKTALSDLFTHRSDNSGEQINNNQQNPTNMEEKTTTEDPQNGHPSASSATPSAQPQAEQTPETTTESSQAESVEDLKSRIASLEQTIKERDARIASLEQEPGADTSKVHSSKPEQKPASSVERFASDMAEARKLFANIS